MERFSYSVCQLPSDYDMSGDERATVAIIDDDQLVRDAVKGLLETVALEVAAFRAHFG